MLLAQLIDTSRRVGETRSRLRKVQALADCLRRLEPYEIPTGVAYLSGETGWNRLGVGHAALRRAWQGAGPPAAAPTLTLAEVHEILGRLPGIQGAGSGTAREKVLADLFGRATEEERDFLARLILGELRQGALEGLMLDAVAQAAGLAPAEVRLAAMRAGSITTAAYAALTEGAAGLARFRLELFRPVPPMLAQPAEDVKEAIGRLGRAAFEWKLDGARIQAHKCGGEVRIYSRNLNDVTVAVPEIVEAVARLGPRELILDGEAIALRPDGTPCPFQETLRRFGRRGDAGELRRVLPLTVRFFDCLRIDADDVTPEPLERRARILCGIVPQDLVVPRLVTDDAAHAQRFFENTLRLGHEGLMAKSLEAPYEAGNRGSGWLKIKRAHTLDLVVLAVERGSGRRAGWLSNLHLGARDPEAGGFVMLGKTFKGMTDRMLAWQTERLSALAVRHEGHVVHVRPELVVEIAFNDIQASSQYPGGLALRFARLRRYREDKRPEDADTIGTVRALFDAQRHRGPDERGEASDVG